jgi:hypothetical protein
MQPDVSVSAIERSEFPDSALRRRARSLGACRYRREWSSLVAPRALS